MLVGIHNTPITEEKARAHANACTPCGKAMETLPMADAKRAFEILNNACLHAAGANPYVTPRTGRHLMEVENEGDD